MPITKLSRRVQLALCLYVGAAIAFAAGLRLSKDYAYDVDVSMNGYVAFFVLFTTSCVAGFLISRMSKASAEVSYSHTRLEINALRGSGRVEDVHTSPREDLRAWASVGIFLLFVVRGDSVTPIVGWD